MIRPIIRDTFFLGQKSDAATQADTAIGQDLQDTPYETEEGCLSLDGVRRTTRYQNIEVEYLDGSWKKHRQKFSGWTAQIVLHELDHLEGRII